jgi:fumarate hydratase class II
MPQEHGKVITMATMNATRFEEDALGAVEIPAGRYWGPQTERARHLFQIGTQRLDPAVIHATGTQKWVSAEANRRLGLLPGGVAQAIKKAAAEIEAGIRDEEFPLPVWQTGSGTQTNMNANEVIANRANELLGQSLGTRAPVHPNDHVNLCQSSNDSFPTVMHIATLAFLRKRLLPGLEALHTALVEKSREWQAIVKLGRTHLMDAVPITLGMEAATWARQVERGIARITLCVPDLLLLPQGGTAAGSGLNRDPRFDTLFCAILADKSGEAFAPNPEKSEGMAAHDALVALSGALNTVAVSLTKIANDIRLLGSGPRGGIAELQLPADGLSSSIMPGKTNATQAEALSMVAARVMGNHTAITIAGAQGHLQLNVFKPLIIQSVLESASLLGDAAGSFARHMVAKLSPNMPRIAENLAKSPMLVTALTPHIGYDQAVAIAKYSLAQNLTLKEAAVTLGLVSAKDFDLWVRPEDMIGSMSVI